MADAASPSHFAIIAWDGPDAGSKRDSALQAHFERIEHIMDRLAIAGPMKDAQGRFTGSLVIVRAADEAEAIAILKEDPYFAAGVWERFEVHQFVPAAGGWIGGTIW